MLPIEELKSLNGRFEKAPAEEILGWVWDEFGFQSAIGTSFQGAVLVAMHIAYKNGFRFPVFTIDTGLLFEETITLKKQLEDFFGITIEVLRPAQSVKEQAEVYGDELWKKDPDLCCTLRKVLPLQEKLSTLDCWITGLRRQQGATRATIGIVEIYTFDEHNNRDIVKVNPLASWSRESVWNYIKQHKIPYNPLHDKGYTSIGCYPCTMPDGSTDNERAGRWVGFNKTECGIHTFMKKKS